MLNLFTKYQSWRNVLPVFTLILLIALVTLTSCEPLTTTVIPSENSPSQQQPQVIEPMPTTSTPIPTIVSPKPLPTTSPMSSSSAPRPISVTLNQTNGNVGTTVGIGGSGFITNRSITIMFDDRVVATVTTDASGFFVATFQVPLSNSGEHIIVATDGENTGRLNFTVKSITPTTPTPTPTSTSISTSTPTPIPTSTKNTTPPLSRNPYPDPDQMKRYVTPNDPAVQSLLQDILHNQIRIFSDFEALRDWASWHISYKYDRDVHGINEYWQLPSETLNLRTGDCEDFAILLCSLLRAYGIPSNQVYVAIGISSDGMHAYLVEKYYKGIWQVVEPQAGVWGGALMQDWFTSESYTELCCFNDQDYFKGSPTLPSGVYESEISTSFYPLTRGSGIAFKRQLEKGEKVTGSFEWMKDYPIIFSWGFTIYDPDGRIVLVENGLDLKHNFSFTPTISGIYTVELIKRDALSRCARFMFNPPDWIKN